MSKKEQKNGRQGKAGSRRTFVRKLKTSLLGFAIETSTTEGRAGSPGQRDRGRQTRSHPRAANRWGWMGG